MAKEKANQLTQSTANSENNHDTSAKPAFEVQDIIPSSHCGGCCGGNCETCCCCPHRR